MILIVTLCFSYLIITNLTNPIVLFLLLIAAAVFNASIKSKRRSRSTAVYIPRSQHQGQENSEEKDALEGFTGCIESYGHACYKHQSSNSRSFFIKLRTSDNSIKEIWGIDLARVVKEKGMQAGNSVNLIYLGSKPVTVPVQSPNQSAPIFETRYRNTWDGQKISALAISH